MATMGRGGRKTGRGINAPKVQFAEETVEDDSGETHDSKTDHEVVDTELSSGSHSEVQPKSAEKHQRKTALHVSSAATYLSQKASKAITDQDLAAVRAKSRELCEQGGSYEKMRELWYPIPGLMVESVNPREVWPDAIHSTLPFGLDTLEEIQLPTKLKTEATLGSAHRHMRKEFRAPRCLVQFVYDNAWHLCGAISNYENKEKSLSPKAVRNACAIAMCKICFGNDRIQAYYLSGRVLDYPGMYAIIVSNDGIGGKAYIPSGMSQEMIADLPLVPYVESVKKRAGDEDTIVKNLVAIPISLKTGSITDREMKEVYSLHSHLERVMRNSLNRPMAHITAAWVLSAISGIYDPLEDQFASSFDTISFGYHTDATGENMGGKPTRTTRRKLS